MNTVIACLWKGDDLPDYSKNKFGFRDVDNLRRGVERSGARFVILVDDYYRELVPDGTPFYNVGIGGWSPMFEAFHPDLWPERDNRHVLVGLDTVFVGSSSWLFGWDESPVGLPPDPYFSPEVCNAVTQFNRKGAEIIWNRYLDARVDKMKEFLMYGKYPSEMLLLRSLHKEHGWTTLDPGRGKILSYKVDIADGEIPEEATAVYFHGAPKICDLPEDNFIKKVWKA